MLHGDGNVHQIARHVAVHDPIGLEPHAGNHHGGLADEGLIAAGGDVFLPGCGVADDDELPRLAVAA